MSSAVAGMIHWTLLVADNLGFDWDGLPEGPVHIG